MATEFGFVRVGAGVPVVRAGAVHENIASLTALAEQAEERRCDLTVFPELCVTAYTCADLFHQHSLLAAAREGLSRFLAATAKGRCVHVVGLPLIQNERLFNCAVAVQSGRVLGVVPKTFLPCYREYYEPRWFAPADTSGRHEIALCGDVAPFGADLLFRSDRCPSFCFGIEICEDLWAPIPPSSRMALAGAKILLNLSASNEVAGKADYRRELVVQQSARCLAVYAYCSAGVGESTTDLVFGGHVLIAENGVLQVENERFAREPSLTVADVDLELLEHDRLQNATFGNCAERETRQQPNAWREVCFAGVDHPRERKLERRVDAHPFTPADDQRRRERCREIFAIQSSGLATRLQHTGIGDVVIGLSGGLDSTLALLVIREAFERLDLPFEGVHCITMPGFGTSARTLGNVEALCQALGVSLSTIDISAACRQHLADIGHDGKTGDVSFENAQARERTQVLMDKANMLQALVVGTGDLSELALGWCTYNGDHMSMYGVNAGVPKTLVRFLIGFFAETKADAATARVLRDILNTPISPELLPPDENGEIVQQTEAVIGPYELHDFFLYHIVRRGVGARKVLFLARHAFGERYESDEIAQWLRVFYERFFRQQFKRSCLPDAPKVGTLALSPRGDWRMPSDASPEVWLAELP